MADADAEAAFINSMQALNNIEGGYEATGASSEQQTDSSSDEYDPAQAVQSPVYNHISSLDASKHDLLPSASALPVTSESTQALQSFHDTSISKALRQSRSMSRVSSSSMDDGSNSDAPQAIDSPSFGNLEEGDKVAHSTIEAGQDMNKDVTDPSFDTFPNTSVNQLSSEDVLIKNHVQDQTFSSSAANGAPPSIPIPAILPKHVGQTSHSESTVDQRLPAMHVKEPASSANENTITPSIATPRVRLPHDRIGILEDRIKEDSRGDLDAWLNLISEHRKRGKIEDARNVYERFLNVFPSAADQWVAYAQMENEAQDRNALENIFAKTLLQIPNVQLWSMYLDHIRRHNNTTTDTSGAARQIIHQAYDLALHHVGLDKDSGKLWQDYVQFIKSGPGIIGGSNWQDQQKMDLLRKTYQRAICVPTQSTNMLWKEYDGFEMGLNKITGRKFLQDQSPSYMSARSSYIELQNITRKLRRTTLAVLPPASGFDGDVEYMEQLEIWKRWIQWEKDDPLVLRQDDIGSYRDRIVFVYKQALMSMRFWPELWCDAADFCFLNSLDTVGNDFLTDGMVANPESCLLAFKRADRLELTTANEEGDESARRRGDIVREPYDKVLDALYDLATKTKTRETQELARIEAQFTIDEIEKRNGIKGDDRNDDINDDDAESRERRKTAQLEVIKDANSAQVRTLTRTISFIWIALMRAMRRIQGKGVQGIRDEGKGKITEQIGGSRQIFTDARKRGRVTSDVYVASALIEFHCYDVDTSKKIFERGLRLFPEDEVFALEYIRYLVNTHDFTNARAVFETVVSKLGSKPETLLKAKPLYAFIHDYESRYGDLAQITKLEKRMSDLFPEDPLLVIFSQRFANQDFDPTAVRPIVSPATQTKPKSLPHVQTVPETNPTTSLIKSANSPKRPLLHDDSDTDGGRPRKFGRGESPLKGAAGRRLDQQKRSQQNQEIYTHPTPQAPPPPGLPRDVLFLLSIIPKAESYHATKFKAEEMVRLIRETNIPGSTTQLRPPPTPIGLQQMPGMSQIPPVHHIHQPQQRPPIPQVSSMPHMQQIQQQLAHAQQMQSMSQAPQPMSIHQYSPAPQGQFNGGYSMISPTSPGFSTFSQALPNVRYASNEHNGSQTGPFTSRNTEMWSHPTYP